ncbi:MAG: outer membrane beta-barrel protein [Pirellulaceae bacterium]
MKRLSLLTMMVVAFGGIARAESPFYVSLFSGWSDVDSYQGEAPPPAINNQRIGSFNDGWNLGGALGTSLNHFLRGELEFTYRNNTADTWTVGPIIGPYVTNDWSGELNSYSGMANLFADFHGLTVCETTPYIGAGLGFTVLDGDFMTPAAQFEIDDTVFSYQFMVGLTTRLTQHVDLFCEYRYLGTETTILADPTGVAGAGAFDYDVDNVLMGLRFNY